MQSKTLVKNMLDLARRDQLTLLARGNVDLDYSPSAMGQLYWIVEQEMSLREVKTRKPEMAERLIQPGRAAQPFYTFYGAHPGHWIPVIPLIMNRHWLIGQLRLIVDEAEATPAERQAAAASVIDKAFAGSQAHAELLRESMRLLNAGLGFHAIEIALIAKDDAGEFPCYELGQPLPVVDQVCPVCGLITSRSASVPVTTCEAQCGLACPTLGQPPPPERLALSPPDPFPPAAQPSDRLAPAWIG